MITKPNLYFDSYYFLAILSDKHYEVYDANNLRKKVEKLRLPVVVPQIVIGEIMAVLLDRYSSDPKVLDKKMQKLSEELYYFTDPSVCLPAVSFEMIDHVSYLQTGCKLDPTDALIVAQVLHDKNSKFLITDDPKMTKKVVFDYEEQLRILGKRTTELFFTTDPD